jgi:hypothetical protein
MRRLAIVLCIALGLSACQSDSTGPGGAVAGTYELDTINGNTLPYTFSTGATIIADQLTLNDDGSYSDVVEYSNSATTIENGVFFTTNNDIQFEPDNTSIPAYGGTVNGSFLVTVSGSFRSAYHRL